MKITFLIPPQFDGNRPAERTAGCTRVVYQAPNIYELTVAAILEQEKDFEVCYRDFIYGNESEDDFERFVAQDDSDIYIFWTVNLSVDNDRHAVAIIRRQRGGSVRVVMMGPGSTYFTRECLVDANVFVVRGEPDMTARELLRVLADGGDPAGVNGISMLSDGKVVNTRPRQLIKDLDVLPFPARHFLDGKEFHNPKLKTGPYTTMVTSRNCPYRCIYCVPSSLTFAREIEHRSINAGRKPPISYRSPASIAREVGMLASQGYRAIGFMDDNFIWNERRTSEICDIMRRHGIVWGCQARVDAITPAIARMLGESNCRYVDLGVESFDDAILEYVRKGITKEDIYRAVKLLKDAGVPVKLNVLIGCSPLETRQTVMTTFREAKRLKVDQVMFNIVSPFPGTDYYRECKKNGWIADGDYRPTDVQRESILNLPELTAKEMERLLFRNNLKYFLAPSFVFKQLKRFSSFGEFRSSLVALRRKLFG